MNIHPAIDVLIEGYRDSLEPQPPSLAIATAFPDATGPNKLIVIDLPDNDFDMCRTAASVDELLGVVPWTHVALVVTGKYTNTETFDVGRCIAALVRIAEPPSSVTYMSIDGAEFIALDAPKSTLGSLYYPLIEVIIPNVEVVAV